MSATPKAKELTEVSEAQIAVHWKEEEYYQPSEQFKAQANMRDPRIFEKFGLDRFPDCFKTYADMLTWFEPYHAVLDTSDAPFWRWFVGGKINASYNCVDRHLEKHGGKAAFIFVPEPEAEQDVTLTYRDLYERVNEMAALLRGLGLKAGDRVTLHMPMVPELPITMLACARLGVIHSQVFGGFSGQACGSRIEDSGSRMLVTMDAYWRNGTLIDHKVNADIAVRAAKELGQDVDKVLVWQRHPGKYSAKTPMVAGRDVFVNDLLKDYKGKKVDPVALPGDAPLFLMYSSGTTGKPKGAQHGIAGYLAYVTATSKWVLDIHPDDVYWCMADIGWITGHSYIVYGPLAIAATGVLYEGVPTYPDAGRPWRIAERLGVNIFHTAPTAIRMLRKLGPQEPRKYKYRFKSMTTVGEPIEPEAWRWYYDEVGKREAVIRHLVDDGDRRLSGHHHAGDSPHEARQLRPGRAGDPSRHLRRHRGGSVQGVRHGGQHVHPQSVAGHHADDLGRPRALRQDVFRQVQQESQEQGLARLAVPVRRRGGAGGRRLLPHPRPHRRRHQRRRPPPRHQRDRVRLSHGPGGRRGRRRPGPGRGQGTCARSVRGAQAGRAAQSGGDRSRDQGERRSDRQDRAAQARVHRAGHAQDPLRQDHAPRAGGDLQPPGRGRRDDAREPGRGRADPRDGAG